MASDPEVELETTRALLSQARADRDVLQNRVLLLEDRVRLLRKIPGLAAAERARRRMPTTRSKRSVPAPAAAPAAPGLYLDLSVLDEGVRTGIPRVAIEWGRRLPAGFISMRGDALVHDCRYTDEVRGRGPTRAEQARDGLALAPVPGVTVVDPAIPLGPAFDAWQEQIRGLRRHGGRYVPLIHDLLPLQFPDFFDAGMRERFPVWLSFVAANADLILTVSDATAAALRDAASDLPPIVTCRSGSDGLPAPRGSGGSRTGFAILMVGTVEPRKAVDVAVDAVSTLRDRGLDVTLILIGQAGWADPVLLDRLAELEDAGWFEWLRNADDQTLADAYESADLLLAASRGEGFGLPLVEARTHGLPTLARDIPAFREALAGDGAFFRTDAELPRAIESAMRRPPRCTPALTRSWDEAVADVADVLSRLGPTVPPADAG